MSEEERVGRYEREGGTHVLRDEYRIASQNEELWDSRAETYEARNLFFIRWTQRKLIDLAQLGDNPSLLDLACGTGWALRYAASRTNGQGEFYGVDNSSKMIEQAQAKSRGYGNLHFYKSRGAALRRRLLRRRYVFQRLLSLFKPRKGTSRGE